MGCPEHEPEPQHVCAIAELCELERCDNCSATFNDRVCTSQLVIIDGETEEGYQPVICIDCADYMEIPSFCREPYTN